MQPKIIAVTGGAGYIGAHLVRQLLAKGFQVRVVDCGLFGFDALPSDPNLTVYHGTVVDSATLYEAFQGVDAVVHLAGLVGDPACDIDPLATQIINIGGTRFVHRVATYCKVPRLIFASSCSVYGSLEKVGREDGPVNPISLYARTKYESEGELLADPNLPVTILRFSTVYGHSARPRFDLVANLFSVQAVQVGALTVKGAHAWRPFVHVADVASAIVAVVEAPAHIVHRRIYNVGSDDQNFTIGELAEKVRSAVEEQYGPVDIQTVATPDDHRNYRVSFDRIVEELGWTPSWTIEAGIAELADYADRSPMLGGYGDYRHPRYHNHLAAVVLSELAPSLPSNEAQEVRG